MEWHDSSLCQMRFGLLCGMSGACCVIAGMVILLLA